MSQNQKYNKKLKHDKMQYKTSGARLYFNCLMYNDYNAVVSYIALPTPLLRLQRAEAFTLNCE